MFFEVSLKLYQEASMVRFEATGPHHKWCFDALEKLFKWPKLGNMYGIYGWMWILFVYSIPNWPKKNPCCYTAIEDLILIDFDRLQAPRWSGSGRRVATPAAEGVAQRARGGTLDDVDDTVETSGESMGMGIETDSKRYFANQNRFETFN